MLNFNKGFWILLPIPFKYIYPGQRFRPKPGFAQLVK